ncbi:MAG: carboxylating nicotinate-nucleotide diphosphorylase [Phycisphaerales bacterium]
MADLNTLSLAEFWEVVNRDAGVHKLLELARDEDLGPTGGVGDITSSVLVKDDHPEKAELVFRSGGVVSGVYALAPLIGAFGFAGQVSFRAQDGQTIGAGESAAVFHGRARDILGLERTALNLVGRMSGIATLTSRYVEAVKGTRCRVLDTRKTTPGWRLLEKYAVRCGGGYCHRMGLYDAVLIKDNHLAGVPVDRLAAFVSGLVHQAQIVSRFRKAELSFVECEVDTLEQLRALLDAGGCGLDIVLLDNMTPAQLTEAVAARDRSGLPIALEASGGVTLKTVRAIAETGVDRASIGALTHQATSLDVGLDFA